MGTRFMAKLCDHVQRAALPDSAAEPERSASDT